MGKCNIYGTAVENTGIFCS